MAISLIAKRMFSMLTAAATQGHLKFPLTTPIGQLRLAANENPYKDFAFFHKQKIRWTFKEMDEYASAFAYGLLEAGYKPGDKLLVWVDDHYIPELLTTYFGCGKAGVANVYYNSDSGKELANVLKDVQPRGILLTPYSKINSDTIRMDRINEIFTSLRKLESGAELSIEGYPYLKHIIQNSHASINGTIKFKHFTVYAQPSLSSYSLPKIADTFKAIEIVDEGKPAKSFLHSDVLAAHITDDNPLKDHELMVSTVSLKTPFMISAMNHAVAKRKYIAFSQSYNVKNIVSLIASQKATLLITEPEMLLAEIPNEEEAKAKISALKDIFVLVDEENKGQIKANKIYDGKTITYWKKDSLEFIH